MVSTASAAPAAPRALQGLRVVDFTAMMAGPTCARWLADMGAEVIKIEPVDGDHMRTRPPLREGRSSFYGHMNAGKRSVALNLKHTRAVELARDLCIGADIVIEAFRPGVMARLGLGADVLQGRNPRLIYCSISGYGQASSASSRPAYAAAVHAASGYYTTLGEYQDGLDRPPNSGIPLADMLTAIYAAMAIQTALLERERGQHGRNIDVNLMDSMLSVLALELQTAQFPQRGRRQLYKPLKTRDGFVIVVSVNENNFRGVCACTGHPEWLEDPLFNSDQRRLQNWDFYMGRIESWTMHRSSEECERLMSEAGVPCSRYRSVAEALTDPQFIERRSLSTVEDAAGAFQVMNLPFAFDGAKPTVGARVAELGEDTVDVLRTLLGLDAEEVDRLREAGAIAGP